MSAAQALAPLFEYKRWANQELLDLGATVQDRVPADDFRLFVRILNHTWVVDRIFACHLEGRPQVEFAATNTDATPALAELREAVQASDDWYLHYARTLDDGALAEPLAFRFTDGDTGRMTRSEMLHHVVVHGTYHRGAAGRILATHGVALPRDAITTFLHRVQPERRG